ncbi:MAG: AAA family ATPase [Anaerolineae bacterium]|nr:AAA family ATPase [Anaerolineae bacterium]
MIRRIVIHRFRGIREGVLDDVGKINVLIGPNNSGKSALLELLYLGGTCGRPVTLHLEDLEGGIWNAVTSLPQDFLGYKPLSRIRLRHGETAEWAQAPAYITPQGGLGVELEQVPAGHPLRRFRLSTLPEKPGEKSKKFAQKDVGRIAIFGLLPQEEAERPYRKGITPSLFEEKQVTPGESQWYYLWDPAFVYRYEQQDPLSQFAVWALEGRVPDARKVFFVDFHTVSEHLTRSFVLWALQNVQEWYRKIYEHLSRAFPDLPEGSISTEVFPGRPGWHAGYFHPKDRVSLMIDHFGDGIRHAFTVLTGLVALAETVDENHPGLFLWEDPELFMHPASLDRLLREIFEIVARKPVQVFITTQSIEVLAWIVEFLESSLPGISPEDVRTIYVNLKNGLLHARVFRGTQIGGWMEFIGDPRLIDIDEMASPLIRLLRLRREVR